MKSRVFARLPLPYAGSSRPPTRFSPSRFFVERVGSLLRSIQRPWDYPTRTLTRARRATISFRVEDWAAIQSTLQAKLDGIDKYRFVFYPDPEVKDEPIVSSISFGLAEIYVDLKQALARDDSDEALWQTRFYFDHHWGRHLADVLHPIHWAAWDG